MPNTLRIKRRSAGGSSGSPASLEQAELAYNESDAGNGILYIGIGTGGSGGSATSIVPIGGDGAYCTLSGNQTLSGNKTFSGTVALGGSATATTPATGDNDTSVATTGFVKAQNYISANQTITLSGDLTGSGTTSIAGTLATVNSSPGTTSGVTVNAKGLVTAIAALQASDLPSITAAKVSDFDSVVQANRLDEMAAPTSSVSFNSQEITNVADPTSAQSAATKAYVDAVKTGLDVKDSVRAATVSNITLANTQTIDGVSLSAGDRVLVKNQSTASENGLYVVVDGGSWTRATDFDSSTEVTSGAFVFVESGSANSDAGFTLTTDGSITVGTTGLAFTQFSGAGSISAGTGLSKSGTTISADIKSNGGIVTESNALAVDLGASSITGTLAVGDGGTGATSASAARTALGVAIGSNVQAHNAILDDLAGLTQASNKLPFFDSGSTAATTDLSAFGRTLIDDGSAAAARTTLGLVIGTNVQAFDADLAALAGLTSAADKLPFFTGSGTASTTDLTSFARTLLDDADASTARSTLGVAIGSDVQGYHALLAAISGLTAGDGAFIVGNGSTFVAESGATARTSLGLGTIATQAANNVSITGGSISNIDLDGGTF